MNASLSPLAAGLAAEGAPVPEIQIREGILEVPGKVALHHGGSLEGMSIAWRLAGPAGAAIVCALGGISASRRVCLTEDPRQSWWSAVAGPGLALDTRRFAVLSLDYIGGGQSFAGGGKLPSLSSYDQAEGLLRVLNHLGIKALLAIAGGSYGGMVALAFGERYPERVGQLIVISGADRAHPLATGWRTVQRRVVRLALEEGRAEEGMQLARALAMTTYRSAEEFAARFDGEPSRQDGEFVFPVERYLLSRGADYAARHRAQTFLALSESIDLHRVDAARIFVPTTAIAVREDQLVPLADMRALAARLPRGRLYEISSLYGHDAFLKEGDQLHGLFNRMLGG
jgi:homoserine O-acetyltransferase